MIYESPPTSQLLAAQGDVMFIAAAIVSGLLSASSPQSA
jgi:hypothetical protein